MAETRDDARKSEHNPGLFSRLARTRAVTGAAIVIERLWPLALPLLIVIALFLSVSWLGLFRLMPDWLRLGVAGLFGLVLLASLLPFRYFRKPRPAEIDRRIERANALEHAPVTTQTDRLATGAQDGFASALWREHQRRMAERLGSLSGDLPRTRVPERDPWGFRAVAALLLVVAFAFSGSPLGGSITDAFQAAAPANVVPARIDAWVTPPPYTRRAPIFLTSDANRERQIFHVPAGSDYAVRITGGSGEETLDLSDSAGTSTIAPGGPAVEGAGKAAARQFSGKLARDGVLVLKQGEAELQSWAFQVTPDNPPVVRITDEPKRAVNGTLELNYEVEDDYGAVAGMAEFAQKEADAPGARPLYEAPEMPLSLPRRGGIAAKTTRDLTEHPWAGGAVELTLRVTDAAGQEGASETKEIVLPQRPFSNPLARAVIEQRRLLALDASAKPRVLRLMDAITVRPDETFPVLSHYLGIMAARSRLKVSETDEQLRGVVDYLWEIALAIEDGDLSAAEKRLRQAQEALKDALENSATDEEIERLMAELREAMNEFLREFAERSMQNQNMAQQQMMPQDGQEIRQSDLQRMLDQIEELAKSGAREQAQQMLQQLQEMMNNLQMAQRQQGQQGQGQQSEMRQQMDELGELMRRQQELMNETFQMDQMQRGQQQRGQDRSQQRGQQGQQGQGQQGQGGQPMSPEEFAEALRQLQEGQGQLGQDLESLMQGLRGLGIEPGEGFGEAGEAMGGAEQALGDQDGEGAVGEQGRALEALRRGAQDMMQQMMQAMQGDEGGGQEGGRRQSTDRDPLGRPRATTGPDFGDTVQVPDEIDTQRARQILEAIRRRLGNALSPEIEREYLERLLEMR